MITNAISIVGSRGHLCVAFSDLLCLYEQGKIALDTIVTKVLNDPQELADILQHADEILNEQCKVLVRFGE